MSDHFVSPQLEAFLEIEQIPEQLMTGPQIPLGPVRQIPVSAPRQDTADRPGLHIPAVAVIAGGGDGACGSAGAGNMHSGDTYLNLGSTAWIARVSDTPVIDAQGRLFNIMNLDGKTTSVYGGGGCPSVRHGTHRNSPLYPYCP